METLSQKVIALDPYPVTRLLHSLSRDLVDELLALHRQTISPSAFTSMSKRATHIAMFLLPEGNHKLEKAKKMAYLCNYILYTSKHCESWELDEDGKLFFYIQAKPLKMVLELDKKLP